MSFFFLENCMNDEWMNQNESIKTLGPEWTKQWNTFLSETLLFVFFCSVNVFFISWTARLYILRSILNAPALRTLINLFHSCCQTQISSTSLRVSPSTPPTHNTQEFTKGAQWELVQLSTARGLSNSVQLNWLVWRNTQMGIRPQEIVPIIQDKDKKHPINVT